MDPVKNFNIKHPVLLLKVIQNGNLTVMDSHTSLRIIDSVHYKVIGGFKTNILQERYFGSHLDVSHDGAYCAAVLPKTNKAALFSVAQKGLLYKVGRHQGEIESLCIDPNGRYFVTGGQDGKAFVWSLKTARLAFPMPPHSDYVTAIAFSQNGQWLATGSFDKTITLLNIASMKKPVKLRGHAAAVIELLFLPGFRLLSVDKEGGIIVWDTQNGKNIKRMSKVNDTVTAISASHDSRFLFVGTKLGYVALYDLELYELLTQRYLKSKESISALGFMEEGFRLAIGTIDGNVDVYALFGEQERYEEMIKNREYDLFYAAVEENPVLMYSKQYSHVEKIWEASMIKARKFLEAAQKENALKLLEPFQKVPKKSAFIKQFVRDFDRYSTFKQYVQEQRFPLAYSLVQQFPVFKDSEAYNMMEKRWKKNFLQAQQLILDRNGDEQARQLLMPYRGISEKAIAIQQLFAERNLYLYFKKMIAQKEFVKMFDLIKNHPFLMEFDEYQAVLDYADNLYIKTQRAYAEEDYITAQKIAGMLKEFPEYAIEAHEIEETIRIKQLFYEAIASGNLVNAFSYMVNYPLLYETKEGQHLEDQWNHVVDKALRLSAKGDALNIRHLIEPYLSVSAKYEAMANLYQQCYNVQLEEALKMRKEPAELEKGMKNYLAMFGEDDFIGYYIDRYNKTFQKNFNADEQSKGELSSWTPKAAVRSILG